MPGEPQHAAHVVAAGARVALVAVEGNACGRVADPVHDAAQEQPVFAELQDFVQHLPIEQTEVGCAGLDANAAQIREHAVIEARGELLAPCDAARIAPDRRLAPVLAFRAPGAQE